MSKRTIEAVLFGLTLASAVYVQVAYAPREAVR